MDPNGPGWDVGAGVGGAFPSLFMWMFAAIAVFGLGVLALVWKNLLGSRRADRTWPRVPAQVLGVDQRVSRDHEGHRRTYRVARYSYRLPSGHEQIAESEVPPRSQLRPGATVEIVHDPTDPTRSAIPGGVGAGSVLVFAVVTLFILGVMAFMGLALLHFPLAEF